MNIRMINKNASNIFRDCTNGKIYEVLFLPKGEIDTYGAPCFEDTYCIKDDAGDDVCAWWEDIEAAAQII